MAAIVGFETRRFPDTDTQATEVKKWNANYTRLIEALGGIGTEVRRNRVLETDQDIQPTYFVRGALHEFIFPPQEARVTEDESGVIDSTPGYSLRKEDVTRAFDETQVSGHIRVSYDDADSRISLHIADIMEGSQLPDAALAAFEVVEAEVRVLQARTS